MYIRGMDKTLNEVQRLLSDQLSGAATVRVTPPEQGETTCKVAVAWDKGKRGTELSFQINGRSATDVASDLVRQIVDQMQTPKPA